MISAIIIDDELHCIKRLSNLLKEYCHSNVHLFDTFETVNDGLSGIAKHKPDLVFLDVQLQDNTGFELLKQVNNISFDIIFTTAFEGYAVEAFRFSAVDYLLKPVAAEDLISAVEKVQEKKSKEELSKKFEVLLHNLRNIQNLSKRISIPTANGLSFVEISDIVRCEAETNYTIIHLHDKQKFTVAKTLKEFENMLTDYNFYRVHNSHLINLKYIKSYNKGKGGSVVMSDQSEIEVSTRRKEDFLKKLSEV